ncbi:MAG: hypothetical protein WDW38_010265 [Sanguina aurantia]
MAASKSVGFLGRHGNVLIYVPNLIGYLRILAALYAFSVAFSNPVQCFVFYFASFVCDELDGRFARMLNQTSTLGAVLDMVTDRLSTTGLLVIVAMSYPALHMPVIALFMLDIFSHWFQMYSTLLRGEVTHKDVGSRSRLVRIYYTSRIFMGFCCVCCEVLYLAIYMSSWPELMKVTIPGLLIPVPPAVHQLIPGLSLFLGLEGLPLLTLLGVLMLPGFAVKQLCNWIQLKEAAYSLVDHDLPAVATKKAQ